ncbi:MAG: thiamine-phosphate kinase [Chloroflexota bacterium]|nr:thiamine-phosphate kinase [Chloroflexota bacterium]
MSEQTVRGVGEFGLIDRLVAALPEEVRATREHVLVAAGDDTAVIRAAAGEVQIVTTDTLVEGIHFRLDWTDWQSLGHKALAVNLSDVASMGALPTVAVVTLGLRGDERVSDLESMYQGLGALACRHGVVVVGGDIVRVSGERLVSVTALGRAGEGEVLLRSGARSGDIIGVTGTIGASGAGLAVLQDAERYRDSTTAGHLVRAHLAPEPRVDAGQLLVHHGASAAMDLSDGMAGDLPKILTASGVSAEINADRLPVIAAVRALFPNRWLDLALRGGEDFELLFTIDPERWDGMAVDAADRGITVTRVGIVLPADGQPQLFLIQPTGDRERLPVGAFDHFG